MVIGLILVLGLFGPDLFWVNYLFGAATPEFGVGNSEALVRILSNFTYGSIRLNKILAGGVRKATRSPSLTHNSPTRTYARVRTIKRYRNIGSY